MTEKTPAEREADCSEVLADIYVYLDRECDGDRKELLQRHLDDCGPCLERYGIEQHIKELLHRKCGGDQAPDQLRERLKASIRKTVSIQETVVDRGDSTVRVTETRVDIERDT